MHQKMFAWVALGLTCLSLIGCSVFNNTRYGDEEMLEGEARLTCSAECVSRGQCGEDADEARYVLGGVDAPTVENHNRVFPDDTPVNIVGNQQRNLVNAGDGQQLQMTFYQVSADGLAKSGWVAGWCIAK